MKDDNLAKDIAEQKLLMTKQFEKLIGLFGEKGDMVKLLVDGLKGAILSSGKELTEKDKQSMEEWRKVVEELEKKGATAKEYVDAYFEVIPASTKEIKQRSASERLVVTNTSPSDINEKTEKSLQGAKDLLKGIFDEDDEPGVGAINDSLETIHYDDPFARGGSKRDPFSLDGGGPPPSAPLKEIFENRGRGPGPGPGPGPGLGGVGALAEPIRVPVSEKQAEKSEDIYDKVFPDSPTMDSPAYKASLENRLTNVNVGKSKSGKKKSEEGPSLDR